jgi:hypothetical protein
MALSTGDRVFERIYADDLIENYDRSEQLELKGLIENMPPNPTYSGFMSAIGDLPTPPYGHPSVRVASAFAEEGICRREIMLLTEVRLPKLQIFSRPIVND